VAARRSLRPGAYGRGDQSVTLTVGTRGHLAGELAAGRLDVAFVFDNGDPATGPHRVVARDEVVLVAAPEHPLARTARPSMEQVLRTPFLVAEPGCTSDMLVDRFGQDLTRGLPVAMVTGSFGALRRLAAHGSGIALLPYLAAVRDVEAGELVLIDIEQTLPPLNVEARWRDGVAGPDRALLDIVLDLTRRHRPPERRPGALTGHRVGPASP
jgi:DNA-binding transcriptional LysR family regulator